MSNTTGKDRFLRWKGAAEHSKMGVRTLKRYASMGRFKVLHPTPRIALIDVASLDEFLEGSHGRV